MKPILLATPWFNVYSYGLFLAIGYTIATFWIIREAVRNGMPGETIFDMLLLQLVVGVFGARLLYVSEYGVGTGPGAGFFAFERGGLTFYGAVISSFAFDILYLKWLRLPFWRVMDAVGFGLPLGIAIARLGCFFNGCCHGIETGQPWGVVFPRVGYTPVHPTQIYESIACLGLFVTLQLLRRRRRAYGEVILATLGGYGILRFFIEFWRGDNPIFAFHMTLSQVLGIVIALCAAAGIALLRQRTDMLIIPSGAAVEITSKSSPTGEIEPKQSDSSGNAPRE
ncbi:MAG TPA: prolipoprotein diacylglyceryl transferase [Candidatus Ozemobacteraceae bacterium]|nr:prolipoprotein diacylglyceryl transferase [Candidatus Ozemobacteraceae bacterium]HQG28330.1 prolipoprotein diacylglyceryl transferase [Candidatus Ozemobacteraceae bacterium]